MKRLLLFSLLSFLLLTFCKEDEPTAPEEKNQPEDVLASTTIGAGGGTLTTEEFTLEVPPGAFDSDTEIKLSVHQGTNPFGEKSVSDILRMDGFPLDYKLPLKISIKHNESLSGNSYIAWGEEILVVGMDTNYFDIAYDLYLAEDASGFLTCELPVIPNEGGDALNKINSEGEIFFWGGVTGGRVGNLFADHFEIIDFLPSEYDDNVGEFLDYLEEAYDIFKNLNFKYERRKWPINVDVWRVDGLTYSSFERSTKGVNFGTIRGLMGGIAFQPHQKKAETLTSFFHLIADLYDKRSPSIKKNELPHGLDYSVGFWASDKYVFQAWEGYWDIIKNNHVGEGLQRIFKGKEKIINSATIKYLVERFGDNILSKIYDDRLAGKDEIAAIINQTASPWEWLHGFHIYMMTDDFFYDRTGHLDYLIENSDAKVTISDSETQKTIPGIYNDLSGKWFKIDFGTDIADGSNLSIKTYSDDVAFPDVSIFKYNDSKLELWETSDSGFDISGIKSHMDGWNGIIVLVSNGNAVSPYTGTSEIELEVKLSKREYPPIIAARFDFIGPDGHFKTTYPNNPNRDPRESDGSITPDIQFFNDPLYGTMTGNKFSAEFDYTSSGDRHIGTIELEFECSDCPKDKIANFSYYDTVFKENDEHYKQYFEIHLNDVPISDPGSSRNQYFLEGEDLCNSLSASIVNTIEQYSGEDKEVKTLETTTCLPRSKIIIYAYWKIL